MNKRWRNVGLYVLAVITVIFIGTSVFDKPKTENATKTLRYSDFIEAVQEKEVSRVLYPRIVELHKLLKTMAVDLR